MRHLVTGATGLIGSEIAAQLRREGHDVVALVRPATSAAVSRCDGVLHSAAVVSSATLTMHAAEMVNVQGTLTLLDAARGRPRAGSSRGRTSWSRSC